jgi:Fur family peroxide stress response transcriptional regulator
MEDRLRNAGLRITPQRLELLKVLEKCGKDHPSFSDVYNAVKAKHRSVSQSTVLKNMATFEEIGIVRGFSFRGETHYELNSSPHVNLVAAGGKIMDVDGTEIREVLGRLIDIINKQAGIDTRSLLVMVE